jgi:hypothetical protein
VSVCRQPIEPKALVDLCKGEACGRTSLRRGNVCHMLRPSLLPWQRLPNASPFLATYTEVRPVARTALSAALLLDRLLLGSQPDTALPMYNPARLIPKFHRIWLE